MPSAAYPFTRRVLERLRDRGIQLADIVLHTGVSSLEVESDDLARHTLYPEPYWVPRATATAVSRLDPTVSVTTIEDRFRTGTQLRCAGLGNQPFDQNTPLVNLGTAFKLKVSLA